MAGQPRDLSAALERALREGVSEAVERSLLQRRDLPVGSRRQPWLGRGVAATRPWATGTCFPVVPRCGAAVRRCDRLPSTRDEEVAQRKIRPTGRIYITGESRNPDAERRGLAAAARSIGVRRPGDKCAERAPDQNLPHCPANSPLSPNQKKTTKATIGDTTRSAIQHPMGWTSSRRRPGVRKAPYSRGLSVSSRCRPSKLKGLVNTGPFSLLGVAKTRSDAGSNSSWYRQSSPWWSSFGSGSRASSPADCAGDSDSGARSAHLSPGRLTPWSGLPPPSRAAPSGLGDRGTSALNAHPIRISRTARRTRP